MRLAFRLMALLLALNAGFLALVVAAQYVDEGEIADNLRRSFRRGELTADDYQRSPTFDRLDMWSECVGLGLNLGTPPEQRLRAALAPDMLGRCAALQTWLGDRGRPGLTPYPRFWHGYRVIIRPLLYGLTYGEARLIVLAGIAALLGALVAAATGTLPTWLGLALIAVWAGLADGIGASLVLTHALGLAVGLATTIGVLLVLRRHGIDGARLAMVFVAGGAVFNFVDFLITPPLAVMLPLFALLAARVTAPAMAGPDLPRTWLLAIGMGGVWAAAYALTWAASWCVAATVLGWGVVAGNVGREATLLFQAAGDGATPGMLRALAANARQLGEEPMQVMLGAAALALAWAVARSRARWRTLRDWLLVASTAVIPIVWYEVLSTHSQIHAWFTWRSLGFAAAVPLLAALVVGSRDQRDLVRRSSPA